MSTLYNVYISGLSPETNNSAEEVIEEFSHHFNNRTEKLVELLKAPRELCFFANISSQQAQDLQQALAKMGLLCTYRPSDKLSERELSLSPMEENSISCPSCRQQQKKPENRKRHKCIACGTEMTSFERRSELRGTLRHKAFNKHHPTLKLAAMENKTLKRNTSAIERAEIVTRESRRTRSLYGRILGFTSVSIVAILVLMIFYPPGQSNPLADATPDTQVQMTATIKMQSAKPVLESFSQKRGSISHLADRLQSENLLDKTKQLIQIDTLEPLSKHHLTEKTDIDFTTAQMETITEVVNQFEHGNIVQVLDEQNNVGKVEKMIEDYAVESSVASGKKRNPQQTVEGMIHGKKAILQVVKNLPVEMLLNQVDKALKAADTPSKIKAMVNSKQFLALTIPDNEGGLSTDLSTKTSFLTKQLIQSSAVKKMLSDMRGKTISANGLIKQIYAMEKNYQAQDQNSNNERSVDNISRNSPNKYVSIKEETMVQPRKEKTSLFTDKIGVMSVVLNLGLVESKTDMQLFFSALALGLVIQ